MGTVGWMKMWKVQREGEAGGQEKGEKEGFIAAITGIQTYKLSSPA